MPLSPQPHSNKLQQIQNSPHIQYLPERTIQTLQWQQSKAPEKHRSTTAVLYELASFTLAGTPVSQSHTLCSSMNLSLVIPLLECNYSHEAQQVSLSLCWTGRERLYWLLELKNRISWSNPSLGRGNCPSRVRSVSATFHITPVKLLQTHPPHRSINETIKAFILL